MRKEELHWLAGLLEGEGSFRKPPPSAPNSPLVTMSTTDLDVAERAAALLGVSVVALRNRHPDRWKDSYFIKLAGKRAVTLMRDLRPLMGTRRRAAIDAAIAAHGPHRGQKVTDDQVQEIDRRRSERAADLAAEYGVSHWLIYRIWNGHRLGR